MGGETNSGWIQKKKFNFERWNNIKQILRASKFKTLLLLLITKKNLSHFSFLKPPRAKFWARGIFLCSIVARPGMCGWVVEKSLVNFLYLYFPMSGAPPFFPTLLNNDSENERAFEIDKKIFCVPPFFLHSSQRSREFNSLFFSFFGWKGRFRAGCTVGSF